MQIDDYITVSRTIVSKKVNENYFLEIFKNLSGKDFGLNLSVVCSLNQKSELLSFNGENIIIIDEYQSFMFEKFNNIFLNKSKSETVKNIAYKLMADLFFIRGEFQISENFFNLYLNSLPSSLNKKNTNTAKILKLQNYFIQAHEISHFIISKEEDKSEIIELRKKYLGDILLKKQSEVKEKNKRRQTYTREGSYFEKFKIRKEHYNYKFEQLLSIVKTRNDFAEENFCDDMAFQKILSLNIFEPEITARAIQLCFLNLITLSLANRLTSMKKANEKELSDYLNESTLRLTIFQDHMCFLISSKFGIEVGFNTLKKLINDLYNYQNITEIFLDYIKILLFSKKEFIQKQRIYSKSEITNFKTQLISNYHERINRNS